MHDNSLMSTPSVIVLAVSVVCVLGWRYAWRYAASHQTVVRRLAVVEMAGFGGVVIGSSLEVNLWGLVFGLVGFINAVMTYRTRRNWWRTPRQPQ
jgi:hypothetical protein